MISLACVFNILVPLSQFSEIISPSSLFLLCYLFFIFAITHPLWKFTLFLFIGAHGRRDQYTGHSAELWSMRLELSIRIGSCFWGKATCRNSFVFWLFSFSFLIFLLQRVFFVVSGIIAGGEVLLVTAHITEVNSATFVIAILLECIVFRVRRILVPPESGKGNHYHNGTNGR